MSGLRLAILGRGRMGRALAEAAQERGDEVVLVLDSRTNPGGAGITREAMAGVDVALEFTTPDAVLQNLDRLTALRVPTVVGTTGWTDRLPDLRRWVEERGAAVVYGANFALGLQVALEVAEEAARRFARLDEFDAYIVETHHRGKRDAPSGTARVLRDRVRAADPGRAYPVTSVRGGWVPGTHELVYDAAGETVTLTHTVRDRRVFAAGALFAAHWIAGRQGLYEFREIVRQAWASAGAG